MAPLPENATARLFVDYTSANRQHTMELRLGEGADLTAASGVAEDIRDWMITRMTSNDSVIGARFSAAGSDFSLPIALTPAQGTIAFDGGSPWWQEDPESAFLSLVGRGRVTGRRARWLFFTPVRTSPWPADNRYQQGEQAVIDTFRQNFANIIENALGTGSQIVTIGGDIPTVYGYVNIAKHGYWQRKQR